MLRKYFLVVIAALFPASLAWAQFHQGDWELTLSGSGGNDQDFSAGNFGTNVSIGHFLTDNWELALRQGLSYTDSGANNFWNASTRVALDYHFDMDRWQPFVGANIGFLYGDQFRDTWAAGPEGGVKYFLNDTTFLYGMVEYQVFFRNASNFDNNFDDGQFVYTIGLGVRW